MSAGAISSRRHLYRASPPPLKERRANHLYPQDTVDLSGATRLAEKPTKFWSNLALFALSAGAIGTGPAQAAEPGNGIELTVQQQIDALVREVANADLQTLSNPRFSGFPELAELQPHEVLNKGEEGEHVAAIQQALLDLGFAINAGATGGLYNQTLSALNNFRSSVNLEHRNDFDHETLKQLDLMTPPPGKTLSEYPTASFPVAQYVNGSAVRVIVRRDEHRLFLYNADGSPEAVYPVATGTPETPTHPGLKIVNYKYNDPSEVAWKLWPESGGRAFGTRMIDLKWFDAQTGETVTSDEEIHGTYSRKSIGKDTSNGCIRLVNEDVESLYSHLSNGDLIRVE